MSRLVQKPYKTTILVRCDTVKRLYVYSAICKLICNQIQQSELNISNNTSLRNYSSMINIWMNSPVTEQNRLHLDTVDGPERDGIRREVRYNTLFRVMSL